MNNNPASTSTAVSPEAVALPLVTPDVDIVETREAFVIHADMPGVDEKSVEVRFERSGLLLRGEARFDASSPLPAEFRPVRFERVFGVGSGEVDAEHITAVLKHGVLVVTLPKAAAVKARRIAIQIA